MHRIWIIRNRSRFDRRGFSLIELVIVVVIIGIVAAIAVPRLGRGASGSGEAALVGNLATLRRAIEMYQAEHGAYPTCLDIGGNKATIMLQLTQFTDAAGNYSSTRSATHRFGPYLRQIPKLGVTDRRDRTKISTADGGGIAWIYNPVTGEIRPNTPAAAADTGGRAFTSY